MVAAAGSPGLTLTPSLSSTSTGVACGLCRALPSSSMAVSSASPTSELPIANSGITIPSMRVLRLAALRLSVARISPGGLNVTTPTWSRVRSSMSMKPFAPALAASSFPCGPMELELSTMSTMSRGLLAPEQGGASAPTQWTLAVFEEIGFATTVAVATA